MKNKNNERAKEFKGLKCSCGRKATSLFHKKLMCRDCFFEMKARKKATTKEKNKMICRFCDEEKESSPCRKCLESKNMIEKLGKRYTRKEIFNALNPFEDMKLKRKDLLDDLNAMMESEGDK